MGLTRIPQWMAHQAPAICASTVLVVVLADVIPATALAVLAATFLLAYTVAVVSTRYHGLRLCPLCAAATPLDAPARAHTRARILRRAHHVSSRRFSAVISAAAAVLLGVLVLWAHAARGNTLALLPVTLILVEGAFQVYVILTHGRLRPWCEQCSGGRPSSTA